MLTCSGGGEVQISGSGVESWIPTVQNAIFSTDRSEAKAAVEKVVVEEGITSLAKWAFNDLENLKEVTLPDTLTSIGNTAFDDTAITSIRIPDSVTKIDDAVFRGCKNLSSVTLPGGLTCIPDSMFSGCESLTGIQIPDGVTTIGSSAFSETSLTELTLPGGVTEIGFEFIRDTPITRIEIPASVENMDSALYGAFNLTEIVLHGELSLKAIEETGLKGLMQYAKQNNKGLTVYGPSGGVVEGWVNKQISESYPLCKFIAND
ncbi:MAG: leucine-rich repeat domain-containing protein [Oscillibacter sp.]|nr:leucine-rich repeat domain-containing protein [Oscillibacter sp.]